MPEFSARTHRGLRYIAGAYVVSMVGWAVFMFATRLPTTPYTRGYDPAHPAQLVRIYEEETAMGIYRGMDPGYLSALGGCHAHTCTVFYSPGGVEIAFIAEAFSLQKMGVDLVRIDGGCYSGCAAFAAYARPRVCVTLDAVLYFHSSSWGRPQLVPTDVRRWVEKHGGFPPYEEQRFTSMTWPDTLDFFPHCPPLRVVQ